MNKDCGRAEVLAGAIALGEASDGERDDYRRHIAGCASCLESLGGEREIERVMATVASGRDSEVWEPVPVNASVRRARRFQRAFGFGLSAAAVGIIASLGVHGIVAMSVRPLVLADAPVPARHVVHISLDRPAAQAVQALPKATASPRRIVVVHNVITLKHSKAGESRDAVRSGSATVVAEAPLQPPVTHPVVHAAPAPSNVPVWRRNVAQPKAVAMLPPQRTTPPILAGRAESIAVAPSYVIRDAAPLGGENAINPQPPPVAYQQGAEGTTAFEVTIDERGVATKCTITKSSGYLSLDGSVCKAAMHAKYLPRTVNGHPVVGVYRDAFTFRNDNDSDSQL